MQEIIKNIMGSLEFNFADESKMETKEYNGAVLQLELGESLDKTYIAEYAGIDYQRTTPLFYINCACPGKEELKQLKKFLEYALNHESDEKEVLDEIKNLFNGGSYYE